MNYGEWFYRVHLRVHLDKANSNGKGKTMSYNGWTNKETWIVNLWVGDNLAEMQQEGQEMDGRYIEDYVWELISDSSSTVEAHFAADLLACAMGEVNWNELAEHYKEG